MFDDLRNNAQQPPDAVARIGQLARLLGPDERAVLLLVAERLLAGRERYGNLDVATDARNFRIEALEEAADGLVYAAAGLMRAGGER